jgi:outer membrane immunogenic protein
MTNRLLTGIAAAALTAAGAFAAQAADLPTRKEAPAPVFVPPPFTWTGFYVGANVGGIWGTSDTTITTYAAGFPFLQSYFPGSLGTGGSGWLGGGQAGYNYQTGMFVIGAETDLDWTSMSRSKDFVGPTFVDANGFNDFLTVNASARLNWIGTTRLRAGFVATPDNRLMFYGTGGFAYGGGNGHLSAYDNTSGLGWFGSKSDTRTGWTLGAGVEYAITNNITLKGEYLYYDLGNSNEVTVANAAALTALPGVYATGKVNYNGSIFRVGANYKF